MPIKFLTDHPSLFITNEKILVIADLHLGLEHEFYESGIIIHSQREKFQKTIDQLIDLTKAKTLVILGDVKHEVPGMSFREEREIPKLFEHLMKRVKVICCKGNHDTYLEEILPKDVKVHSSKGFKIGKYGFFHGHAWPSKDLMECDHLFTSHIHPAIEFRDQLGYRAIEQVWVRGRMNEKLVKERYKIKKCGKLEIIIVPAFNKLLGGVALNLKAKKDLIGPVLSNKVLDIDDCKVYLLDGTYLGMMRSLKKEKN